MCERSKTEYGQFISVIAMSYLMMLMGRVSEGRRVGSDEPGNVNIHQHCRLALI